MLSCGPAGFAKTFEWHLQKGNWKDFRWTVENAEAAGFPIPKSAKNCSYELALKAIFLEVRKLAEANWNVRHTPFFVIGGKTLSNPNWEALKDLLDNQLETGKG